MRKFILFILLFGVFAAGSSFGAEGEKAAEETIPEFIVAGPEGGFLVGGETDYASEPAPPPDQPFYTEAGPPPPEDMFADPKDRLKEIVSVSFNDVDLKSALSILAENYDLNILTSDDVKGAITINFKDVPLEDVLKQMLQLKDFTYKWEGNIIKVVSAEEEIETKTFTVSHISLDLASEIVIDRLSKDGKTRLNTATNQLIITDTLSSLGEIEEVLKEIDVPPAQVRIETKLIDISHTHLDNLGLSWATTNFEVKLPGSFLGSSGPGDSTHEQTYISQLDYSNAGTSSDLTGGQYTLQLAEGGSTMTFTVDALIRKNKAKVIANPSITTLNNVEARINIGEKYPIREQTQTSTGTLETTRFVDIGTTLKVTPKINEDGTIQLIVHPEVSSVNSTLDAGPRITTREADTTVIVNDGDTVIIAGLLQTQDTVNKNRIPFFGSLPIFGPFFSSRDKDKEQKELVVFITPHILNRAKVGGYKARATPVSEASLAADRLGAIEMFSKAEDLESGESLQAKVFPKETRIIESAKLYEQVSMVFPDNYYADIALYRAGNIYEKKIKDYESAKVCYDRLVENYPESSYVSSAKKRIRKLSKKLSRKKK